MSDESQKLRLKPRLLPDAPQSPAETTIPEASAFTPPVAEAPPPLPAQEAPPAFRLKPKLVEQVAAGAPPPVVLNAQGPAAAAVPLQTGRSPSELEAAGKKVQFAALVIGAVGAVVFAVVGYLAYSSDLFASDSFESGEEVAFEEAEAADNSPRANTPESEPQTSPTEITPQAPAAPVIPSALAEPPPSATVANEAAAEPSAAFRTYVSGLKILGVRAGANPRVLIDRSSYNVGATINEDLGVVFVGYDAAQRTIRFKDASGAIIDRPDR
jgi:hypothetical protein